MVGLKHRSSVITHWNTNKQLRNLTEPEEGKFHVYIISWIGVDMQK